MNQDRALQEFAKLCQAILAKHQLAIDLADAGHKQKALDLLADCSDLDMLDMLANLAEGKVTVN
jgi:hypothetical protein